jgi:hypothetical protein
MLFAELLLSNGRYIFTYSAVVAKERVYVPHYSVQMFSMFVIYGGMCSRRMETE